ncbi:MAG: AAA family ATPase [Planctomycetota bacterium]
MIASLSKVENAPAELRESSNWVAWNLENNRDGKPTKIPKSPQTGREASSTDPATWGTLDDALEHAATRGYSGVGCVLAGDGIVGVDLDDCLVDGKPTPDAQEIIYRLDTYCEVSPSGTGVKLWIRGKKPGDRCSTTQGIDFEKVEIYERARYFTVTGDRLDGTPSDIREDDTAVKWLYDRVFPEPKPSEQRQAATPADLSDTEIIEKIRRSKSGQKFERLWNGDTSNYNGDDSAADLALCGILAFWLQRDHDRIDRVFRQCALYREKWDEARGEQTYGDRTIEQAVSTCKEVYTPPSEPINDDRDPAEVLSFGQLCVAHPQLKQPVVDGLLRRGETMNLIAASKMGKSWLVYDLATSIITGRPWLNRFTCHPGRVLLIDNELHPETLAQRIPKVADARLLEHETVDAGLDVLPLRGRNVTLDDSTLGPYLERIESGHYSAIVLDAWYRFIPGGLNENLNSDVMTLYNRLDRYAASTEAAWVVVHHASKGQQGEKSVTDVGAGAGAQSRAADTHLVLRPHEEEDHVVLEAAVRSFAPVEPLGLRWEFPLWQPAEVDTDALKGRKSRSEERNDERLMKRFEAVKQHLANAKMTTRMIRDATGWAQSTADNTLTKMLAADLIKFTEVKKRGQTTREFSLA